jgi:hypothetical protein
MPTISSDLSIQINALKQKYPSSPETGYSYPKLLDMDAISGELLFLKNLSTNNQITHSEKLIIESYRLTLLNIFCKGINEICQQVNEQPIALDDVKPKNPPYTNYYTFLGSGLVITLIHGYLSSRALLVLIPTISDLALGVVSTVMTVLNGYAYYLYEGYVLKKNLGIPILDKSTKEYLSLYENQMELMPKINEKLNKTTFNNHLKCQEYKALTDLAGQFNESVLENSNLFKYKESMSNYIVRLGILSYGAVMAAGGTFFSVKSFLTLLAPTLLATPVAMAMMGVCATLAVVFYLGQRPHKIFKMLNPSVSKFEELQPKFVKLAKQEPQKDFAKVLQMKFTQPNVEPVLVAPEPVINKTVIACSAKFLAVKKRYQLFQKKKNQLADLAAATATALIPGAQYGRG